MIVGIAAFVFNRESVKHTLGILKAVYTFRAKFIYPVIPSKEPKFGYQIMRWLYSPLSIFNLNIGYTSEVVSKAMPEVGLSGYNSYILVNSDIKIPTA